MDLIVLRWRMSDRMNLERYNSSNAIRTEYGYSIQMLRLVINALSSLCPVGSRSPAFLVFL
jgi:hypothetical protein